MKIILRNFDSFKERVILSENKLIDFFYSDNYDYQGYFKKVDDLFICFFRKENNLFIMYNNSCYPIDTVEKLSEIDGLVSMKIKFNGEVVIINEKVKCIDDIFTQQEKEDISILYLIYNISKSEKRKKIIFL
ncbi:MAG: hypothetical protein ACWA41_10905 [Putridiphycobacter sp.]